MGDHKRVAEMLHDKFAPEELTKFEKAFEKPEFRDLLREYMQEISDPQNKAENDAYLRQLEEQGQTESIYGKGVQMVVPKVAFVVKARDTKGHKAFINICSSEKIEKYTITQRQDEHGAMRSHLSMPNALGPPRMGVDRSGDPCTVVDFAVHPETITFALASKPMLDALANIAMEQLESILKDGVKLERKYAVPKMKFKRTEAVQQPGVMTIRTGAGGEVVNGRLRPNAPGGGSGGGSAASPAHAPSTEPCVASEGHAALTASPPGRAALAQSSGPGAANGPAGGSSRSRSSFAFCAAKAKPSDPAPDQLAPQDPGFRHPGGEVTPAWSLLHRGTPDLAATWKDAGRNLLLNTTLPKELVLRVVLPGLTSAACVDLDVTRSHVHLVVPGKYRLAAALPHAVDTEHSRARFLKDKAELEVVMLVVVPSSPPPLPSGTLHPARPRMHASPMEGDLSADCMPATSSPSDHSHRPGHPLPHPHPCQDSDAATDPGGGGGGRERMGGQGDMTPGHEAQCRDIAGTSAAASGGLQVHGNGMHPDAAGGPHQPSSVALDASPSVASSAGARPAAAAQHTPPLAAGMGAPAGSGETLTPNQRRWMELHSASHASAPAHETPAHDTPAAAHSLTLDQEGGSHHQAQRSALNAPSLESSDNGHSAMGMTRGTAATSNGLWPAAPATVILRPRLHASAALADELD